MVSACVLLVVFAGFVMVDEASAHQPDPRACVLAWERAEPGSKWAARQVCVRGQARHAAMHERERVTAQAHRACRRVNGSGGMGHGLCAAIASVRPAWAANRAYHELLRRESSWNTNAINRSSGACGAFQRLQMRPLAPCPWPVSAGRVHASALVQTRDGVRYIVGRYGSPERALAWHSARGWY